MQPHGFTILELVVVLIILGVLVTTGITYFGGVIERSRGAEAKLALEQIRYEAVALYLQERGSELFTDALAGIGGEDDSIPGPTAADCISKHYFWYKIEANSRVRNFSAIATRCLAGGKQPQGILAGYLKLSTNFTAGTDIWMSDGGY